MKSRRLEALRAALEKAEFRLAATQDLALVGDWELDRHTGRMYWSRGLFRLFDRPEALGVPDINEALVYMPARRHAGAVVKQPGRLSFE